MYFSPKKDVSVSARASSRFAGWLSCNIYAKQNIDELSASRMGGSAPSVILVVSSAEADAFGAAKRTSESRRHHAHTLVRRGRRGLGRRRFELID